MNPLGLAQRLFLQSAIRNALEKEPDCVRFTLLRADREIASIQLIGSEENATLIPAGTGPVILAQEAIPDTVLSQFEENADALVIDNGEQTIRYTLKGTSFSRETIARQPSELKTSLWAVGKTTHLDPNQAALLLKTIGLMTPDGEIKAPMRKKFKQVNHFLDLVSNPLRQEPGKGTFTLVDCGCGKTYLGFVLFWYIQSVLNRPSRFFGIDTSEKLIEQCRERAETLGLRDMIFQCLPIRDAKLPKSIDLLVSLHACDTATDEAIVCGIVHHAKQMAIVPCCQHELADQIDAPPMYPLTKHGIFKNRFADLLTDMVRALFLEANGYTVTAGEFVSPEETPKNLMLRASLGNPQAKQRAIEYQALKSHYNVSPSIDRFLQEQEARRSSR